MAAENGTVCTCASADNGGGASVSRFVLSGVLGSALCIAGIVANLVVIGTLLQPRLRKHSLLFVALAVCDIVLLAAYLPMHSLTACIDQFQWAGAHHFLMGYICCVFFVFCAAQTATLYAAVLAVFEHTLAYVCPNVGRCVCRKLCGIMALIALGLFSVAYSAAQLSAFDACPPDNWDALVLWPMPLKGHPLYEAVYRTALTRIVLVNLPSIFLNVMGLVIMVAYVLRDVADGYRLHRHRYGWYNRSDAARLSHQLAHMALGVVCLHWLCWWSLDWIQVQSLENVMRLLHVVSSAAKLPVYMVSSRDFRRQVCGGGAVSDSELVDVMLADLKQVVADLKLIVALIDRLPAVESGRMHKAGGRMHKAGGRMHKAGDAAAVGQ